MLFEGGASMRPYAFEGEIVTIIVVFTASGSFFRPVHK
jgi:hypothetical protein